MAEIPEVPLAGCHCPSWPVIAGKSMLNTSPVFTHRPTGEIEEREDRSLERSNRPQRSITPLQEFTKENQEQQKKNPMKA